MIFWESDLNFVTVLLDAINLGHLLLQKPNGAGDRRVHAATISFGLYITLLSILFSRFSSTFHQTMSDLIVSSHVRRGIFSYFFFCLLIAFNDDHHHHFRLNGDAFLFGLVRIIYFTTHPPTPFKLFTCLRKMFIFGGLAGRASDRLQQLSLLQVYY